MPVISTIKSLFSVPHSVRSKIQHQFLEGRVSKNVQSYVKATKVIYKEILSKYIVSPESCVTNVRIPQWILPTVLQCPIHGFLFPPPFYIYLKYSVKKILPSYLFIHSFIYREWINEYSFLVISQYYQLLFCSNCPALQFGCSFQSAAGGQS